MGIVCSSRKNLQYKLRRLGSRRTAYRVELTGDLPPGIQFRRDQLRLYFEGTPLAVGDFGFTLRLEVVARTLKDQEDIDSLCRTVESGNYVIQVSDI